MKRILLAIALLGINISPASPQLKEAKPETPGTTRVAVVNIGFIFNNYERAKDFKVELEKAFEPFKAKAKKLTDEMTQWEAAIKADNGADEGKLTAEIQRNKRELEALSTEMEKELGRKQEDNLVTLWKVVQGGIKDYATENKLDLVLGYGDPLDKGLLDLFPNINRKMQAMDGGSTVPLFVTARTEVAPAVTDLLNVRHRNKGKAPKVID